ncbi:ankyrin repeat-containing protein [Tieghemostelium lacteum]|uniref:Ankyrin repeat-containing protein n=1 Tax=Tieghemostelium lacteum TaxID=361077 RepID=A0A152A636_TIELA|nr:ankyrin repeat-containing protein [Tieghemostelium lacteum]|eukprot:KYR01699.1 ankyrin repeat-containing protein [Tieghemostelium lacteum]
MFIVPRILVSKILNYLEESIFRKEKKENLQYCKFMCNLSLVCKEWNYNIVPLIRCIRITSNKELLYSDYRGINYYVTIKNRESLDYFKKLQSSARNIVSLTITDLATLDEPLKPTKSIKKLTITLNSYRDLEKLNSLFPDDFISSIQNIFIYFGSKGTDNRVPLPILVSNIKKLGLSCDVHWKYRVLDTQQFSNLEKLTIENLNITNSYFGILFDSSPNLRVLTISYVVCEQSFLEKLLENEISRSKSLQSLEISQNERFRLEPIINCLNTNKSLKNLVVFISMLEFDNLKVLEVKNDILEYIFLLGLASYKILSLWKSSQSNIHKVDLALKSPPNQHVIRDFLENLNNNHPNCTSISLWNCRKPDEIDSLLDGIKTSNLKKLTLSSSPGKSIVYHSSTFIPKLTNLLSNCSRGLCELTFTRFPILFNETNQLLNIQYLKSLVTDEIDCTNVSSKWDISIISQSIINNRSLGHLHFNTIISHHRESNEIFIQHLTNIIKLNNYLYYLSIPSPSFDYDNDEEEEEAYFKLEISNETITNFYQSLKSNCTIKNLILPCMDNLRIKNILESIYLSS